MLKFARMALVCICLSVSPALLADVIVSMHSTSDDQDIGTVTLKDGSKGLVLITHLYGLPPGKHGFHVHENANCDDHGNAAGGHLDPAKSGKHLGPYSNKGHLGDLPVLTVTANGTAEASLIAPRLKVSDVLGHSLMIHENGDNYSDQPKKLGGGGSRIACGSIPTK